MSGTAWTWLICRQLAAKWICLPKAISICISRPAHPASPCSLPLSNGADVLPCAAGAALRAKSKLVAIFISINKIYKRPRRRKRQGGVAGIEDYGVIWPQLWQQPVEAYGPNLRGMRVRARPKPCRERERGGDSRAATTWPGERERQVKSLRY